MSNKQKILDQQTDRIIVFDLLRIVAISLVVLLHTVSPIVSGASVNSTSFIIANILNGISRIGVPIFFMISGALMLNEEKEISIKMILNKYVKNIAILLVCWSFFYACLYEVIVPLFIKKEEIVIIDFLTAIINGSTHLWFLFVIIGLYLITPFLRTFVKKDNSKLVLYFIILAGIFCLLPKTLDAILYIVDSNRYGVIGQWLSKFSMGFVLDCTIYYLLGWYIINNPISKRNRMIVYIIGGISLIYTILSVQLFSSEGNYIGELIHNNLTLNIYFYATSVFLFFWYTFKEKTFLRNQQFIVKLSNLSFGVYLIHIAVLYLIGHFLMGQFILIRIFVGWLGSLGISFGLSYVLSKIPLIKKLIRG